MKKSVLVMTMVAVFALIVVAGCNSSDSSQDANDDDDDDSDGDINCPECAFGCNTDGSCIPECVENTDCVPGMFCDDGMCVNNSSDDDDNTDDDDDIIDDDDDSTDDDDDTTDGDIDWDLETDTGIEHSATDPWIQADHNELDFGAVPIGTSPSKDVIVQNIGGSDLVIDAVYLYFSRDLDSPEMTTVFGTLPITVSPTATTTITVQYSPVDLVAESDYLVIHSNDPSTPDLAIPISTDTKEIPLAEITPQSVNMECVRLGDHVTPVKILNMSGLDLIVSEISLQSDSSDFSAENIPEGISTTNPYHIPGRGSLSFDIHYIPTEADCETETATVMITSNDEQNPFVQIPFTASACEPEIDIVPTAIDYSDIAVGYEETRCTTVTNLGCLDLEFTSIELTADADGSYTWDPVPDADTVLAQDEQMELCVHYSPSGLGNDMGTIEILNNDADEPTAEVELSGNPVPSDIDCEPLSLEFDPVSPGQSIIKTISCRNVGAGRLLVDSYEVTGPGTNIFYLAQQPSFELSTNQSTIVKIGYRPEEVGQDEGELIITSNDPDESPLVIDLLGGGVSTNTCPVSVIEITEPPIDEIEPLNILQLDGSSSYDPDVNDTITQYMWTVQDAPVGSTSMIAPPNTVDPTFFVDLAGTYKLKLTVWDNHNTANCNTTLKEFTAVPGKKIHIQLIWNTGNTDMDLHLVKPQGSLWTNEADCYYTNCRPTDEVPLPVDWDDCGHPTLDIDRRFGYGPENINLDDPCDTDSGDYAVFVHFWDTRTVDTPTTATVRIYILGLIAGEYQATFDEEHYFWHVANIRWNNDTGTVFEQPVNLVNDPSHGQ